MSTRLITTYEEAKALKDAGWPQDVSFGSAYYVHWYAFGTYELKFHTVGASHPLGPQPLVLGDGGIAALRLDELLAFLWERGWEPTIRMGYNDERGEPVFLCEGLTVNSSFGSQDQIAALVGAVLHVLNSTRSPE